MTTISYTGTTFTNTDISPDVDADFLNKSETGHTTEVSKINELVGHVNNDALTEIRNTAAWFTSNNPVLGSRQIGKETDTGKEKHGDGVTAWNGLHYKTFTGTFTPSLSFTATEYGYAVQYGRFVKTGQSVSVQIYIRLSYLINPQESTVKITGLPFTQSTTGRGGCMIDSYGVTVSGQVSGITLSGSNDLFLSVLNNGSRTDMSALSIQGASEFYVTLMYNTDQI